MINYIEMKGLDNIETCKACQVAGLLKEGVKAGEIVACLKNDFDWGYGHAMAIYATFKGKRNKQKVTFIFIYKHRYN